MRYFLDIYDGDWYLIKADHRAEWDAWVALDRDPEAHHGPVQVDEAAACVPDFVKDIGGAPNAITFAAPRPI